MRNVSDYNTCMYMSLAGDRSTSHDTQWLQSLIVLNLPWLYYACELLYLPCDRSMSHVTQGSCAHLFYWILPDYGLMWTRVSAR
jgi:hypothetical protein